MTSGDDFNRGANAQAVGDYAEAIRDYSAAISKDSDYVNAYTRRGESYMAIGNYASAIGDYQQAAKKANDGATYISLGDALLSNGQRQQAQNAYAEAAARLPHNPANLQLLGERELSAQDTAKASAFVTEALAATPTNWRLWDLQARIQAQDGFLPDSLESFARALEQVPDGSRWEILRNRAGAYIAAGYLAESVADYSSAISLQPRRADLHLYLASAYDRFQQLDKAEPEYQQALELDPTRVDAARSLAALEQQRGDRAKALAYYQQALAHATANDVRAAIEAQISSLGQVPAAPPAGSPEATAAQAQISSLGQVPTAPAGSSSEATAAPAQISSLGQVPAAPATSSLEATAAQAQITATPPPSDRSRAVVSNLLGDH